MAHLTHEFWRAMQPDRTILIDLGELARGFPTHPEWYAAEGDRAPVTVHWDGGPLSAEGEAAVRAMIADVDVIYGAETMYDWRIVDWARDAGVRTALHVMPEFWRQGDPTSGLPLPDAIWAPTSWRMDLLPAGTRLVPVPVATDRFPPRTERAEDGPLRVLHTAGHRAAADRNGTQLALRSAQFMSERVHLTVAGQDGRLPSVTSSRRGRVTVASKPKGQADYWDVYAEQDVLLLPRRYGGLSLPVQEGMAAGLVPVLPECSPNQDWPAMLVRCRERGTLATPGGQVPLVKCNPPDLAAVVDRLARDEGLLAERRALVAEWVQAHSWTALEPLYRAELERACS